MFIEAARSIGKLLAERKIGLVYGGGSVGLMGEVADAVLAAGGQVATGDAREAVRLSRCERNMLLNAWAAAVGQPAYMTSNVEKITGKHPRTFEEWADHAAAFR